MKYCDETGSSLLSRCILLTVHQATVLVSVLLSAIFSTRRTARKDIEKEEKAVHSKYRISFYVPLLCGHVFLILLPATYLAVKTYLCFQCLSGNDIAISTLQICSWTIFFFAALRKDTFLNSTPTCRRTFQVIIVNLVWILNCLFYITGGILTALSGTSWLTSGSNTSGERLLREIIYFSSFAFSVVVAVLGCVLLNLVDTNSSAKVDVVPAKYSRLNGDTKPTIRSSLGDVWDSFSYTALQMRKLWPYLWPETWSLRLRVFMCILTFIGLRVINVLLPVQYKILVDHFTGKETSIPIAAILVYAFLMLLYGAGISQTGLLENIRLYFWLIIKQYASQTLQMQVFQHVHRLSLRWHIMRRTGQLIRALSRSADAVEFVAGFILFQVFPPIVDSTVAIFIFAYRFGGVFAFVFAVTMVLYVLTLAAGTQWSNKLRKDMNKKDLESKAVATDSVLNYEVVKTFTNEEFEADRFLRKVQEYQTSQWTYMTSLRVIAVLLNIFLVLGLLACLFLCAAKVVAGTLTAGDFVMFVTYINQIMSPLYQLSFFYRQLQEYLVDVDLVTDLLNEEAEDKEDRDFPDLTLNRGVVEFRDVSFGYADETLLIRNLSFKVSPGETLAIVGPSGSGKSTILRLLFRFYDASSGSIFISDQDISKVNRRSVRRTICLVPQDTILFNDTIYYNINYGRPEATEEEIKLAALASNMHFKILRFPEGYETKVGERGLRLSGGEKQRVSIARTLLKDAQIVVFDEATSSLDTKTEKSIQSALKDLSRNKTCIVVAHRLSTIASADWILVLKDGQVVEQGKHDDLLEMNGLYNTMWDAQAHSRPGSTGSSSSSNNSSLIASLDSL